MDVLQIALIGLIAVVSFIFLVSGWMVFFILKDMHRALKKLNEILYGNSLSASKGRSLLGASVEKKISKPQTKEAQKRFFKKSS